MVSEVVFLEHICLSCARASSTGTSNLVPKSYLNSNLNAPTKPYSFFISYTGDYTTPSLEPTLTTLTIMSLNAYLSSKPPLFHPTTTDPAYNPLYSTLTPRQKKSSSSQSTAEL